MVKAYVVSGLGIGCQKEAAHAYELAGADVEIIHFNRLLSGASLEDAQILNLSGGFLHGDRLGSAMCAVSAMDRSGLKDRILEFADKGNVVYGQCNGYQMLVKSGLLPGIDGNSQVATLTDNDCGSYRVAPVWHEVDKQHFAFEGLEKMLLWCRHGEGKLVFGGEYGSVDQSKSGTVHEQVNDDHVLLRYVDALGFVADTFPENPNGSVDGIAGMRNEVGTIFGHMAHTEVGVYGSRHPDWFMEKDFARRLSMMAADFKPEGMEGNELKVFENIVGRFK